MTGVGPAVFWTTSMRLRTFLACGLAAALSLATSVAPATARTPPFHMNPKGGQLSDERTGFETHDATHIRTKLRALRAEAISLQKADGGKLSDAHRADLEARLAILHKEACAAGLGGC